VPGRIDVPVNNAGMNHWGGLFSLTAEDWYLTFAVSVKTLFHICRSASAHGDRLLRLHREHRFQTGIHPGPPRHKSAHHSGLEYRTPIEYKLHFKNPLKTA
jgi:NAD(P)-dependent dehydrogenase (short-subunit alcohol dehydrogenase family)